MVHLFQQKEHCHVGILQVIQPTLEKRPTDSTAPVGQSGDEANALDGGNRTNADRELLKKGGLHNGNQERFLQRQKSCGNDYQGPDVL